MLKLSPGGYFKFFVHILIMFFLAVIIDEEYNLAFVFFVILVLLFFESIIRFILLSRKYVSIEHNNKAPFLLTHVNKDISLFFSVEKSDFKHKKPKIHKLKDEIKKTEWIDSNTLKITLNVSSPCHFKLKDILFTDMDLINMHEVSYITCNQEQSFIILPEPVRNKEIEKQINNMGKKTKNHDYILGLREYQHGDRFKDINWKQSSKYENFQVNQFYAYDEPAVTLFIDTITDRTSGKKAHDLLIKNITHLIMYSTYKKYIKKIIMNDKIFMLNEDMQKFWEELATSKRSSLRKKTSFTIEKEPDMLIITTRKGINLRNCVIVEKT